MSDNRSELELLQQQEKTRKKIEEAITRVFAPEDEALRYALTSMREAGLPEIQISPIQGKFLQLLAAASNARSILEIGSLGGYSGIWLARALPLGGRLITLEINPKHAAAVRQSCEKAGLSDRTELRLGTPPELLRKLESEA